ncbi:MAG: MoaD/ThiS family protein [Bdellovibrionaceae bacterium]|jgi:sulfur-carrier protein|nr:MoaD/ThiS family protein [Pseudobdellovibrionaceae bacterium]
MTDQKLIKVRYFAALREQAGIDQEKVSTQADTAEALYTELKNKYNFSLDIKNLKLSYNLNFSDFNQVIHNGDELVFIPPVAGG